MDGSSDEHPVVGRVGGYGVYFGDASDTALHIPPQNAKPIEGRISCSKEQELCQANAGVFRSAFGSSWYQRKSTEMALA